jgi:hypothetical protein
VHHQALRSEMMRHEIEEGRELRRPRSLLRCCQRGAQRFAARVEAIALAQPVKVGGAGARQQGAAGGEAGDQGLRSPVGREQGHQRIEVVAGAAAQGIHEGGLVVGSRAAGARHVGVRQRVHEADGTRVQLRELRRRLLRRANVASDPGRRAEALDRHRLGAQQSEDTDLQGVERNPRRRRCQQDLAVVKRHRGLGPMDAARAAPQAVERIRQVVNQRRPEMEVLFAAALHIRPHHHHQRAVRGVGERQGIARPRRVAPAPGVEQVDAKRGSARRQQVSLGQVGEHHQDALRRHLADGGQEPLDFLSVEEARRQRVHRRHDRVVIGAEAQRLARGVDPPRPTAPSRLSPGGGQRLREGEVDAGHIAECGEGFIAQQHRRAIIEHLREVDGDSPPEALVGDEATRIDRCQGEEATQLGIAPRCMGGELLGPRASDTGQVGAERIGERGRGIGQRRSERLESRRRVLVMRREPSRAARRRYLVDQPP